MKQDQGRAPQAAGLASLEIVASVGTSDSLIQEDHVKIKSLFLILALMLTFNHPAEAAKKKGKARAYSFFDDGGKHNQAECDPEKKVPRGTKRQKKVSKFQGYLGSELVEKASESPDGVEAWKHYFTSSGACIDALKSVGGPH